MNHIISLVQKLHHYLYASQGLCLVVDSVMNLFILDGSWTKWRVLSIYVNLSSPLKKVIVWITNLFL